MSSEPKKDTSLVRRRSFSLVFVGLILIVLLVVAIVLNDNHTNNSGTKVEGTISADNGDQKINWERYPTTGIELSESLNITTSGTYHLTGTLSDGLISVKVSDNDGVVRLILDNVTIKNSSGPAIVCYSGDDLVIELIGENTIEDSAKYSSDFDEDVKSVIYSKADLTIGGDGILNLAANHQDGIVSKDDLKFNGGTYSIKSADDGIRGKDSVYIVAGTFNIDAAGDAIKSTNETTAGKGFVLIEDGVFNLTSINKGIKAINSVLIYDGDFNIVSRDDAIHSNNYIGIIGGNFSINSGDDGIHADRQLIIDGGKISIERSYEGLEAQAITINDGEISIKSSDDGINAGGGVDSSSINRVGANPFDSNEECILTINGGDIYINASGDGIDSNGYLYFNGGYVVVDGPTNNGNGALDAGISIVMNGGEVVAVGASGMAESLGNTSTVYNVDVYFSSNQSAGTKIEIKNSNNETIVNHTSAKSFSHLATGTSEFELGGTYTIYLNGVKYQTFTISNITTTIGNNNQNQNMMPGGNRGR